MVFVSITKQCSEIPVENGQDLAEVEIVNPVGITRISLSPGLEMLGAILEVVIFDLLELGKTMCEALRMVQQEFLNKDHLSMDAVKCNIIEVNL